AAEGTGAGSGLPRRAVSSVSNVHRVYLEAVDLDVFPVQSMPVSVSRGQTSVVPLSLTFTNGGGPGASDIRLRSLRLRLEDGQGTGIVPSELLSRVSVNEGTSVYLDRTSLETTGAEVDLTLATPVLITGQEPVTLSLRLDVSSTTLMPSFRVSLADSVTLVAEDANSGAPVVVHREGGAFPILSGVAQIVSEATELRVAGAAPQTVRLARGATDAPILTLTLVNPGVDAITSDVRVNTFGIGFEDTLGNAIPTPSARVRRVTVRSAIQTLATRDLTPQDGAVVTLVLSPPVAVPVNVPLDLTVSCDLADSTALGAFRVRLQPPGTVDAEDAITRDPVVVSYATDPILGSTFIVEAAAAAVVARGEPRIPASCPVGDADVHAMRVTLRHPSGPGTARIRVDGLTVQVRDETRAPLVPATYLDALRVVPGGLEIGSVPNPPSSGSSVAVPLAPFWIEPGDSMALDVRVDVSVNAPVSWLEIALPGSGIGAADANSGAPVPVTPAPGTDLPLVSGLTRLASPARDLVVGWEPLLPAVLAADGAEVAAARIRLANTAASGSGSIRLDRLRLQASDRSGNSLSLGSAVSSLRAYGGGSLWGVSDTLGSDSTLATVMGASALEIQAGATEVLEIRVVAQRPPGVDHFRIGLDGPGIGVVQPGGALLAVQVSPEPGSQFPFWTEAGTFTPSDLAASYSNFPNPFPAGRGRTTFAYYLRMDARVT
ncbi:MAG TPA: hypothetical protein VFV24_02095, partial [Candidatus Eisenbacteria bacterium]|nr:hypothetical protein [Candidatus Eisenbacteria bacterium]